MYICTQTHILVHTVFAQDVSCCQYDAVMLLRLMFSIDDGDMRALLPCMRVYVYMLSLLYEAKNTQRNRQQQQS